MCTPSNCIDIGIRISEFVAKTQFLYATSLYDIVAHLVLI